MHYQGHLTNGRLFQSHRNTEEWKFTDFSSLMLQRRNPLRIVAQHHLQVTWRDAVNQLCSGRLVYLVLINLRPHQDIYNLYNILYLSTYDHIKIYKIYTRSCIDWPSTASRYTRYCIDRPTTTAYFSFLLSSSIKISTSQVSKSRSLFQKPSLTKYRYLFERPSIGDTCTRVCWQCRSLEFGKRMPSFVSHS